MKYLILCFFKEEESGFCCHDFKLDSSFSEDVEIYKSKNKAEKRIIYFKKEILNRNNQEYLDDIKFQIRKIKTRRRFGICWHIMAIPFIKINKKEYLKESCNDNRRI